MGFARRHPLFVSFLIVAVLVLAPIAWSAISVWRAAHTDEASLVDHADVILVLGAAQYDGRPSPVFQSRLDHGHLLYDRGFADRIMVLGSGRPGDVTTEAQAGVDYLEAEGIPPGNLEVSPEGSTTFESLREAAKRMEGLGLHSAFLVSDPWHNARIRHMARDLGIEGYVSATFASAARTHRTRFEGYVRETFAYLWYRLFGD